MDIGKWILSMALHSNMSQFKPDRAGKGERQETTLHSNMSQFKRCTADEPTCHERHFTFQYVSI